MEEEEEEDDDDYEAVREEVEEVEGGVAAPVEAEAAGASSLVMAAEAIGALAPSQHAVPSAPAAAGARPLFKPAFEVSPSSTMDVLPCVAPGGPSETVGR